LILKGISGFLSVFFPRFAPLNLKQAEAFIGLTTSTIGLTPPSIPTPDEGVKSPSIADVRMTCFDAQLLAVPARLLATFGRLVDTEVFSIKNFNLLKTNTFCSKRVDKNGQEGKFIFSLLPFFDVIGGFDYHIRIADKKKKGHRKMAFFMAGKR
jgi:hypothetical protein